MKKKMAHDASVMKMETTSILSATALLIGGTSLKSRSESE